MAPHRLRDQDRLDGLSNFAVWKAEILVVMEAYSLRKHAKKVLVVEILGSWGSIGCDLALKLCGGAKKHITSKTQKAFGEISSGVEVIQIINYFNVIPKSKLREIK